MSQASSAGERGGQTGPGAARGATAGGASGAVDGGYVAKLSSLLRSNTVYQVPPQLQGNPKAIFAVKVLPDCSIASIQLKRSSGVPAWDQAAERGIARSSPLPRMPDGDCPRDLEISRGPRDER
jgi:colicin import membrane protein